MATRAICDRLLVLEKPIRLTLPRASIVSAA